MKDVYLEPNKTIPQPFLINSLIISNSVSEQITIKVYSPIIYFTIQGEFFDNLQEIFKYGISLVLTSTA